MEYDKIMIKFSVVIPLYNKEKDIEDTINSVLDQSCKADEIIVVDDGSTDNGKEIVSKNFRTTIKIISQKNLGVSMARNRGIKEAKNEYICLLDGDDLWEVNFLEEIKNLITLFPKAIFYSTAHKYIDEEGNTLKSKVAFRDDYMGVIENFVDIFSKNYGLVNSSSVCIRKSSHVLFPKNEKRGEDICVWLELSLLGSLGFSAKPLSVYRLDSYNRSGVIHKEAIVPCPIKWFFKNKEKLKLHEYYSSIRRFIYSNIFITVYGGYALRRDNASIRAVINEMKNRKVLFRFILYPAFLMPIGFLEYIRYCRRKLR